MKKSKLLDNEEMAEIFKDEPFHKNQMAHRLKLIEKFGKSE